MKIASLKLSRQAARVTELLAVVAVAAMTRLLNLDLVPPFIDETGQIYIAVDNSCLPTAMQVTNGRVLASVIFLPTALWADNPLITTRLLIGVFGILTTVGVYCLTSILAGWPARLIAGLLWSLLPLISFHERLAIPDPLVCCFSVWSLFCLVRSGQTCKRGWAFGSGVLLGLAILTKFSAAVAFSWVFLIGLAARSSLTRRESLSLFGSLLLGTGLVLSFIVPYLPAFFSHSNPYLGVFLANPAGGEFARLFWTNLSKLESWFTDYDSRVFEILAILALLSPLVSPTPLKMALSGSFILTVLVHCSVYRFSAPRYLTPYMVPLVTLIAIVSAESIRNTLSGLKGGLATFPLKIAKLGGILISILLAGSTYNFLVANRQQQRDPRQAQIPGIDMYQYFDGWPSGTGLKETVDFLNHLSTGVSESVVVLTELCFRHGSFSLPLLMKKNPSIEFRKIYAVSPSDLKTLLATLPAKRTLLLIERPFGPLSPELLALVSPAPSLLFEYKRPRADGGFQVYEIQPSSSLIQTKDGQCCWFQLTTGWHGLEQNGSNWWRWTPDEGEMIVSVPRHTAVSIAADLYSIQIPNLVRIQVNAYVLPPLEVNWKAFRAIKPLQVNLRKGINRVRFASQNSSIQVDGRPLAVAIKDLTVTDLAPGDCACNFSR